ncbi:MAG: hypothetical protein EBU93_04680 [Chlamydiae bacterium]|nr:hypothetical protein [Chlamydiota bacterium]
MNEELVIYIDRLESGKIEEVDCSISPQFMDVQEEGLSFEELIHVKGNFYSTPDHLIGQLSIETSFNMPCTICDERFSIPVIIENHYITEPLENIPSRLYYPHEGIREALLLETPSFCECHDGNCPNRESFATLIKQKRANEQEKTKSYLPFKDLE